MAKRTSTRDLDGELQLAIAAKKQRYKDSPLKIIWDGLVNVQSTVRYENGQMRPASTGGTVQKFIPTHNQRMILLWFEREWRAGRPVSIYCLKKRREGLSTLFKAIDVCRAVTTEAYSSLTVAHKPTNTQKIYEIGRRMFHRFPSWFGIPSRLRRDSAEYMEVMSSLFDVSQSSLQALTATTDTIGNAHGMGVNFLHASEKARYDDPEAFEEATNSVILPGRLSADVGETTANGQDVLFYPQFKNSWEEQGACNFWDEGYRSGAAPSLAVFFPAYSNETDNRVALPDRDSRRALEEDMDEYEKWVYAQSLPLWEARLPKGVGITPHDYVMEIIYWRRCKLPSVYRGKNVRLSRPASAPYSSVAVFQRMEPFTVDEAFSQVDSEKVFSDWHVDFLRENVRYPDLRCTYDESSGEMEQGSSDMLDKPAPDGGKIRMGWSWWLDGVEIEKCDPWASIDFAEGQGHVSDAIVNWARDFSHGVVYDRSTGIQIGEFISQAPNHKAARHFLHGLTWLKGKCGGLYPYLIWESTFGKPLKDLVLEDDYPWDRLYFRGGDEDSLKKSANALGFYPAPNAKISRVQKGVKLVDNGWLKNRSDMVASQATWYVEKKRGVYEALHKDGVGVQARDDGITATCQLCYAFENVKGDSYDDPSERIEDEDVLERPTDEEFERMSWGERSKLLMRARELGYRSLDELPERMRLVDAVADDVL